MLTYADLADLEQSLNGRTVLSVYVNGEEKDPAKRRRWRIELKNILDEIESSLAKASHAEREDFAGARTAVERRLSDIRGMVRTPGWVGFYTADEEHHAGAVPAPVPTMAMWTRGSCLTPYVRALKEARPVIVLLADRRSARIFKYAERKVELVDTVLAEPHIDATYHMSKPARTGFHTGTRGNTASDEAQREIQEATMHMLQAAVERIAKLANNDAWIIAGGIPNVAAAALARLPDRIAARAMHAEGMDVHATNPHIAEWARRCASEMRDRLDLERIKDALESAAVNGLGATGLKDTALVLDQGRARELYFTLSFLERHPAEADIAVRKALGTRAQVEQVSGQAAAKLDAVGGIAARLRYALPPAAARALEQAG